LLVSLTSAPQKSATLRLASLEDYELVFAPLLPEVRARLARALVRSRKQWEELHPGEMPPEPWPVEGKGARLKRRSRARRSRELSIAPVSGR